MGKNVPEGVDGERRQISWYGLLLIDLPSSDKIF